jgi:hypothetical protein
VPAGCLPSASYDSAMIDQPRVRGEISAVNSPHRIAVLPSAVADQIAAGEVVERPASVVKELVENALDAGATTIDIAIGEGGRALVRVSDDGAGMSRDDATLSIARHATSKIQVAADLVGVLSFGFRGEALPAIGSVSRMEIATSTADGSGTLVRVAMRRVVAARPFPLKRCSITRRRVKNFFVAPAVNGGPSPRSSRPWRSRAAMFASPSRTTAKKRWSCRPLRRCASESRRFGEWKHQSHS